MKWEYKIENSERLLGEFELNKYGKEGWILLMYKSHIFGYEYIFMRMIA